MDTKDALRAIRRCPMWRLVLIPIIFSALGAILLPGARRDMREGMVPVEAAELSMRFPAPNTLPACAEPGAYSAARPPHAYQPGDTACDGRRFGVPAPQVHKEPLGSAQPLVSNNHYVAGVGTSAGVEGIYAGRAVTSPAFSSSTDVLYVTMNNVLPTWSEIGWAWFASGSPFSGPMVFADSCYPSCFTYYPRFPISVGSTIWVVAENIGNNEWGDYIYWNSVWNLIYTTSNLSNVNTNEGIDDEMYTGFGPNGSHLVLQNTSTSNTQLATCTTSCQWVPWDTNIPNSSIAWQDAPYHVAIQSFWNNWYAYGGP